MTEEDVFDILYAAKKYLVDPVVQKCMDFLNSHVTTETVCPILTYALFYEEEELVTKCLRLIRLKTKEVVDSEDFNDLSKEAMQKIVESEVLTISEDELLEACIGWCKQECSRCGDDFSPKFVRQYLGESFYCFRLMNITDKFLYSCFLGSGILSDEEEAGLNMYLMKQNNFTQINSLANFASTARRRVTPGEHQCDLVTKCSGSSNTFNVPRLHKFSVSEDILLHGIDIVDSPHSCITAVQVAILQDSETLFQTVLSVSAARRKASFGLAISLFLPKHIQLHAGDFQIKLHFRSMGGNANVGYCSPPSDGVEANGVCFQMSCPDVFHIGGLRFSVV